MWDYLSLLIASVFLFVFLYSTYEVWPFLRCSFFLCSAITWKKHRAVFGVLLIAVSALLYVLVCVQAHAISVDMNAANVKVYTLCLLLPQISLFFLFTLIFYTWFVLAHTLHKINIHEIKRVVRYVLLSVNVLICVGLCALIVTVFVDAWQQHRLVAITYAAHVWSMLVLLLTVLLSLYSWLVARMLLNTVIRNKSQPFARREQHTVRRLLIVNTVILAYFVLQSVSNVLFVVDIEGEFEVLDSLGVRAVDAVMLLMIMWMYHPSLQHLLIEKRATDELSRQRLRSTTNTLTTKREFETSPQRAGVPLSISLSQLQSAESQRNMHISPMQSDEVSPMQSLPKLPTAQDTVIVYSSDADECVSGDGDTI